MINVAAELKRICADIDNKLLECIKTKAVLEDQLTVLNAEIERLEAEKVKVQKLSVDEGK